MKANPRLELMSGPTGPPATTGASPPAAPIERMTWRLDDVAKALGISRRAIERERSAGRFPRPDMILGRMPLWRPETIRGWVEGGGL